jgi:HEPN domain
MNSNNALKRKVDDLHKQAGEIEELGIKLLEEAPFEENPNGGHFYTLDYRSPLKKIQREAIQKYQQWYSTSLQLVDEYTSVWLNDFTLHYFYPSTSLSIGVMEYLKMGVYTGSITRGLSITEFVNGLEAQLSILLSIPHVVEVKEMSLRKLITADVARTEIEQAEILLDSGFERAAGSIAGVALELHLKTLCDVNGISYPPKPTIETLVQALYKEKKIDVTELKQIQYLGSIRNKCSHPEPVSAKEVQSLIDGVKKLI